MLKRFYNFLQATPEVVLSIIIFFTYWLFSKQYYGPAYLSDEIAYLAKAALISGHVIDYATSWHAGYSLFLAPLFILFESPFVIWQAAMVLNAFLWACSFFILAMIVRSLFPDINKPTLLIALGLTALYPTWITMSGYVFPTTAFAFVFLIAIKMLLFWKGSDIKSILPHSVSVGFLYWIHPMGLAVSFASLMVISFECIRNKKLEVLFIHSLIVFVIIIGYKYGFHQYLEVIGTPDGLEPSSHYPTTAKLTETLLTFNRMVKLILIFIGQLSGVVISSMGIMLFGTTWLLKVMINYLKQNKTIIAVKHNKNTTLASSFMLLSLLTALGVASLSISRGAVPRVDHWIYGRYVEMVVLPILVIGFICLWKGSFKKWQLAIVVLLIPIGFTINSLADVTTFNNIANTSSFWPQYLISIPNYISWFLLGSIAIIAVLILFSYNILGKAFAICIMVSLFLISIVGASEFHANILDGYSKPTAFVDYIRSNYDRNSCIGFDSTSLSEAESYPFYRERRNLYSFYLYDYNYRRMTAEEWLENCEGVMLTHLLSGSVKVPGVRLVGMEANSGLYLLEKNTNTKQLAFDKLQKDGNIYLPDGWDFLYKISIDGTSLKNLPRQVGYYQNGSIFTNNNAGFLTFGPYRPINEGQHLLKVYGAIDLQGGKAWLDIAANKGESVLYQHLAIVNSEGLIIDEEVYIDYSYDDIEIRIWVDEKVDMRIDAIELMPVGLK